MVITFYNNWKQATEIDLLTLTFKHYKDDEQIALVVALFGFGMVIVINKV